MKSSLLIPFLLVTLSSAPAFQGRAQTAGQVELRKYESTHEADAPPPPPQQLSANKQQLDHEAAELSALAQSIPLDINSVTRGTLPKDLLGKLKRIEKLSKQLRSQIAQ